MRLAEEFFLAVDGESETAFVSDSFDLFHLSGKICRMATFIILKEIS